MILDLYTWNELDPPIVIASCVARHDAGSSGKTHAHGKQFYGMHGPWTPCTPVFGVLRRRQFDLPA